MNDTGDLQETIAIEKLSKDGADKVKITKLVHECASIKGANPCETAYKTYECYVKAKAL